MSPASQCLAPREGLESLLVKMGRTGPLAEPRHRPQAGKSGYPRSQNANTPDAFSREARTKAPPHGARAPPS